MHKDLENRWILAPLAKSSYRNVHKSPFFSYHFSKLSTRLDDRVTVFMAATIESTAPAGDQSITRVPKLFLRSVQNQEDESHQHRDRSHNAALVLSSPAPLSPPRGSGSVLLVCSMLLSGSPAT